MAGGTVVAVLGRGIVDADEPVVRADDLGFVRGESVFETIRVAGGTCFDLAAHLERLARGALAVAIELPDISELAGLARLASAGWGPSDGALRLVVTKGSAAGPVALASVSAIPAETLRARAEGVSVASLSLGVSASARVDAPWLLGGVKTTSYAVAMAAVRAAVSAGAADAIWVSSDGEVLEAATSTVAWIADGVLSAPPAEQVGILPGTTWAAIAGLADRMGLPAAGRRISLPELRACPEVMLLSSVRGVTPVLAIDGWPVADGAVGPWTARLRAALEAAVTAPGLAAT